MAGNGVGEFEAAHGFVSHDFLFGKRAEIRFVRKRAVGKFHRAIAVKITVVAASENARIERHAHAARKKVRIKIHGSKPFTLAPHVFGKADDAVHKEKFVAFIQRLFPVVQRTHQLFAVLRQQTVVFLIAADFLVQSVSRGVFAADDLIGGEKKFFALFARELRARHNQHFSAVIAVRKIPAFPRGVRHRQNRVIRRLPHDFRQRVIHVR